MPSIIKLVNGDKVYATQEPGELARIAAEHSVIPVGVQGKPDVFIVVANIATIAEGAAPSGRASF